MCSCRCCCCWCLFYYICGFLVSWILFSFVVVSSPTFCCTVIFLRFSSRSFFFLFISFFHSSADSQFLRCCWFVLCAFFAFCWSSMKLLQYFYYTFYAQYGMQQHTHKHVLYKKNNHILKKKKKQGTESAHCLHTQFKNNLTKVALWERKQEFCARVKTND